MNKKLQRLILSYCSSNAEQFNLKSESLKSLIIECEGINSKIHNLLN